MQIPVKRLTTSAVIPTKAHYADAGFDLYADSEHELYAGTNNENSAIVKTGIAMAIPDDHVGLVWDRSSMGAKKGVHRFAGVIDAGYRGEIMVALYNFGPNNVTIKRGDRIAQILIQPVPQVLMVEVDSLDSSERGEKGFGSSGN